MIMQYNYDTGIGMGAGAALTVEGMPPAVSLLEPGRLYAVVHDEGTPVAAIAGAALLGAPEGVWISSLNPERELAAATSLARTLAQAVESGRVRIFRRLDEGAGTPSELVSRLGEELDYFAIAAGALVVLDGADHLLDDTGFPLGGLKRWAEAHGSPLLLLFPSRSGRPDPALRLTRVADHFAGFARLRKADSGLKWEAYHWFGAAGASTGRSFPLALREDGRLVVCDGAGAPEAAAGPAVDEGAVIALAPALAGSQAPPASWVVAEGFDALWPAVEGAVAATVILPYGRDSNLDELARAVFRLRRSRGPRIKIVVREVSVRLRYSQEQLLLRLGTNLVVPAEVGFSRLQSLLGTVRHQVFSRPLESDYEAAVAQVMPVAEQGYLPPAAFVRAVEGALKRSEALSIQSVLVHLPLVAGLTAADALRYCTMKRPGDVATADGESVYLFLFACRENDIAITLDRLFRLPVTELFEGEVRHPSPETIRSALEALPVGDDAPDYSAALAGAGPDSPAAPDGATSPATEPGFSRRAALSAVPRPLPLRLKSP